MAGVWIKIRRGIGSNGLVWIKMTVRWIRVAEIDKDDAALPMPHYCMTDHFVHLK